MESSRVRGSEAGFCDMFHWHGSTPRESPPGRDATGVHLLVRTVEGEISDHASEPVLYIGRGARVAGVAVCRAPR